MRKMCILNKINISLALTFSLTTLLSSYTSEVKPFYYNLYEVNVTYDLKKSIAKFECEFDYTKYDLYDYKSGEKFLEPVLTSDIIVAEYKDQFKNQIDKVYVDKGSLNEAKVVYDVELNKKILVYIKAGKVYEQAYDEYVINKDFSISSLDSFEVGTSLYAVCLLDSILDVYSFEY